MFQAAFGMIAMIIMMIINIIENHDNVCLRLD